MSRQFDDHVEAEAEKAQHLAVASELGVSAEELSEYDYDVDPHHSDDGVLYGYNVTFPGAVPPSIEDRLHGDYGARWLRIGPL